MKVTLATGEAGREPLVGFGVEDLREGVGLDVASLEVVALVTAQTK